MIFIRKNPSQENRPHVAAVLPTCQTTKQYEAATGRVIRGAARGESGCSWWPSPLPGCVEGWWLPSMWLGRETKSFFCKTQYKRKHLHKSTYIHPYERTHTLPLRAVEHLRETASKKLYPMGLEIYEVTTGVSLSTWTSPPTKEYSTFNETPKCQPGVWTLMGWRCHCPPNHSTTGWFSRETESKCTCTHSALYRWEQNVSSVHQY
jgi:hypothetical protein